MNRYADGNEARNQSEYEINRFKKHGNNAFWSPNIQNAWKEEIKNKETEEKQIMAQSQKNYSVKDFIEDNIPVRPKVVKIECGMCKKEITYIIHRKSGRPPKRCRECDKRWKRNYMKCYMRRIRGYRYGR